MPLLPGEGWTMKDWDAFDHLIDMLTGVFLNEKAARIRLLGYREALDCFAPDTVMETLRHWLLHGAAMPTPGQIRAWILRDDDANLPEEIVRRIAQPILINISKKE